MKADGYSLLEALFVLAIAGIVIGMSAPFLVKYRDSSDFEAAAEKVVAQIRRTKMLAVSRGEIYTVCVPLGNANRGNSWRFFTVKKEENECGKNGGTVMENIIPYRVFQKNGKTEIKKIRFHPRGTSVNKSFCIENKNGGRWKKITVSGFARITVTSHSENPCD